MTAVITSLLFAAAIGFCVSCLLWPRQSPLPRDLPLLCCLSVVLGFGASSLLFFVWLVIFGSAGRLFVGFEIVLLLVLSNAALVARRGKLSVSPRDHASHDLRATSKFGTVATVAFALSLTASAMALVRFFRAGVNGGWDAWGIWNLRARFLFLSGQHWRDAFSTARGLVHVDYPLLVPASVARVWAYTGSDTNLAPILIASIFTAATLGLLLSALLLMRNKTQALLAATLLLGSQFFLVLAAAQYADVPLGSLFLASFVLLCLHEVVDNGRPIILAGAAAGLAAWTKNEGILFVLCLLVAHASVVLPEKGWREYRRQLSALAIGMAPAIVILAYFKLTLGGSDDSFPHFVTVLKMIGRISRWRAVSIAFADQLLHFGGWRISMTLLLAVYWLAVGVDKAHYGPAARICSRALVGTFGGYFLVYLTTPLPLDWLVETSLNRVLMQLWPSALFVFFLCMRSPERELAIEQR